MNSKLLSLLLAAVVMIYLASSVAAYRMRRAPVNRVDSGTSGQQGGGTSMNGNQYVWTRKLNGAEFPEEAFATTGDMSIVKMRSYPTDGRHITATVSYDFESSSHVVVVKLGGYYGNCFYYYENSFNFDTLVNGLTARDGKTVDSAIARGFDGTGEPLTDAEKAALFSSSPIAQADCGSPADRIIVKLTALTDLSAISSPEPTKNVDFMTVFNDNHMVIRDSYMP